MRPVHRLSRVNHTFFWLILIFCSTGCVKEEFDSSNLDKKIKFESGLATPVGYRTLTMNDFFQPDSQRYVTVDDNGLLTLHYNLQVKSPTVEDYFVLNDLTASESILNDTENDWDLSILQDSLVVKDTVWIQVGMEQFGKSKIDRIELESLEIDMLFETEINGRYNINIPNLTKNGNAYEANILPNTNFNDVLLNCTLMFQEHEQATAFPVIVETLLYPTDTIVHQGTSFLNIDAAFNNAEIEEIHGNFYDLAVTLPDTYFDLNIYESIPEGTFRFSHPELTISTNNSFGLPIGLGFEAIEATTRDGGVQKVEGEAIPDTLNPWVYKYLQPESELDMEKDSLMVHHYDWNFADLSALAPERIDFNGKLLINPNNNENVHFITKSSRTWVNFNLSIPVYGYAQFLSMADTMEFQISDFLSNEYDPVHKAFFRFYVTNSFPVAFNLQVYVANENFMIFDSLFTERQAIEPGTHQQERYEPNKNEPIIAEITQDKFEILKQQGFYLISHAHLQTAGYSENPPNDVGIFDYHYIDINLGLVVNLKGTSDVR